MKSVLVASFFCFTLFAVSCKEKEYTCRCEGGLLGGSTFMVKAISLKKAQKICADNNDPMGGAADGLFNCTIQ